MEKMYVNYNNLWWFFLIIINLLNIWITNAEGQLMSRRRTSNVCSDNSDCPSNAYCEKTTGSSPNGQCICSHNFIIVAENGFRQCYKQASTLHDSCHYSEQCMITLSTDSQCLNGECVCLSHTHYVERTNRCYKSVKIGDFCRLTNNCIGEGSVCRSGICICPNHKHTSDMTDCISDIQLGEKCNSDNECIAENTRCHDICRCKVDHVIDSTGKRCLKVATHIYDNCEEDHQCSDRITYSACDRINQTCACREGYHELKYKCWATVVNLGEICEVDENCALINRAICLEGRCICRDGWKQVKGFCSLSFRIRSQRILVLILLIYLFIS